MFSCSDLSSDFEILFYIILFESSCCVSIWNFGIGLLRIANVEFLIPPFFFFWLHCMAYRSLLIAPEQQIEPRPTAVKMLNPNHWTAREIPLILHLNISAYSFILFFFFFMTSPDSPQPRSTPPRSRPKSSPPLPRKLSLTDRPHVPSLL